MVQALLKMSSILPPMDMGFDWGFIPSGVLPFLIFAFRTIDLTIATVRMFAVVRGRRITAWILGLIQATFFVLGVAGVLGNLQDPWNLIAYAAGFGTGSVLGIVLDAFLAPGHSLLRIVSTRRGNAVLEALHREGHGATELSGKGRLGTVSAILCFIPRRRIDQVKEQIINTDPEAFITVDHVREIRGGWRA